MLTAHSIGQKLTAMQSQHNALPHVLRLGALFSEIVLLKIDDAEFYLHFEKGALVHIQQGISRKTPWRFAFITDSDALNKFWQPYPEAGFHDIFGLVKIGRGRIDGDILCVVKNLRFFKEFLALGRPLGRTLGQTKEST